MDTSGFEEQRLDIVQVLKKSFRLYKEKFKVFIILSSIIFALNITNNILNYVLKLYKSNVILYILFTLLMMVFFLINIYVSCRAGISIYLTAEKLSKGRSTSVKEVFIESKDFFWRYTGVSILYGIISAISVAFIFLSYKFIQSYLIKYSIISLIALPTIFLVVRYNFAPVSTVLKKEKHKYFEDSRHLVDRDFLRILFLILISSFIFIVPYQIYIRIIFNYSKISDLHKLIASSVNQFLLMFTTPFSYIVSVVMYLDLKRNKRIG